MTNNPVDLYCYAEQQGIDVDWLTTMCRATSLSVPLPGGTYAIAINAWRMDTVSKETVCLAHELGHCETGSFYNPYAVLDIRQKHENRADKWAIRRLIPEDEMDNAIAGGCTDFCSLAEHFGVTEDFMRKAVCLYAHGNLNAELYF